MRPVSDAHGPHQPAQSDGGSEGNLLLRVSLYACALSNACYQASLMLLFVIQRIIIEMTRQDALIHELCTNVMDGYPNIKASTSKPVILLLEVIVL